MALSSCLAGSIPNRLPTTRQEPHMTGDSDSLTPREERDVVPVRVPGGRPPCFQEQIARERLGMPTFEICIWERVGPTSGPYVGCLVSGGEPRILTRGKRKGQKSWSHLK